MSNICQGSRGIEGGDFPKKFDKRLTNVRQRLYYFGIANPFECGEKERNMKTIDLITRILVIVGGLNWGLVGVAKFDLVAAIFGAGSLLANIVYTLVGISAVVQVIFLSGVSKAHSSALAH